MTRRVDEKKTRKALARLRRAKRKSEEQGEGEEISLSEWEAEFIASVEERLEEYGSAFANPEKGDLSEPLSALQNHKVKEIHKKASGKARKPMKRGGGLQARKPMNRGKGFQPRANVRDISDDFEPDAPDADAPAPPAAAPRPSGPPKLTVVKGGKEED
ncbi:hypothetical protein [Euryhalocaulis caribicus]|uniref:hypothetical protein n=1 Tax=Euryhalocaulis caribicus TaxID=1161401 RepID=UPI0003A94133|nr:hypothetical protein [Euryhalocaulis caribicus]